jgi:uncharacterized protein
MSLLRPPTDSPDDQEPTSHSESGSTDEQSYSPESDPAPPRRIPNLGHALLFVSFAASMLLLFQLLLILLGKGPTSAHGSITVEHPKLQLATMAAGYLFTLITAWFFYPIVWQRTFLNGISWNWRTASSQAAKLIPLGLLLGLLSTAVDSFITPPKTVLIDKFFLTPADAWLLTLFGTLAAPVFEETCFRGFFVPAFAIAYDWLSLPRTPEAHARWQATTSLTPMALIFSAILSSILFALLHGEQVSFAWGAMLVLFSVSLVLSFVRVKTQSVAASALVHSAYNSLIFLGTLYVTGGYRHLDRLAK